VNILLWILQILLALHTVTGALWKYMNSEQTVPSLSAIPHGLWMALGVVELLCALGLVAPMIRKRLGFAAPIGAILIGAEMLMFTTVHIASGTKDYGPVAYWLVVAALCAFVAYGRLVLRPHAAEEE